MTWFADLHEAEAFMKKTKPPAGTTWHVVEDEVEHDEFQNEPGLGLTGGYHVHAVPRWPIE